MRIKLYAISNDSTESFEIVEKLDAEKIEETIFFKNRLNEKKDDYWEIRCFYGYDKEIEAENKWGDEYNEKDGYYFPEDLFSEDKYILENGKKLLFAIPSRLEHVDFEKYKNDFFKKFVISEDELEEDKSYWMDEFCEFLEEEGFEYVKKMETLKDTLYETIRRAKEELSETLLDIFREDIDF